MEKILFDSGIKEYEINNNGVLRFNPSDPNVYARFFDAAEQILQIEQDLAAKGESVKEKTGEVAIRMMQEADKQVKDLLGHVFGPGNDFDELMGGVNIMAPAKNGERAVTNLLQALLPIIEQGAKKCADQKVGDAVKKAKTNRAKREAQK